MTSRRQFLRSGAAVGAVALSGCLLPPPSEIGGGGGNGSISLTGDVAAGGVGSGFAYEEPELTREDATHVARNADQLDDALDQATPENQVIVWIPPDAAINYTGRSRVVTYGLIASTRTVNHPGGMIYSNSMGQDSSAWSSGDATGVLELGISSGMTGVRYRGPTSAVWDHPMYPGFIPFASGSSADRDRFRKDRYARGINITHGSARVDNCEVFGWPTMGIAVGCPESWNRDQEQSYPRIRNCSIHDCGLSGYGYGVEVDTGHPVVENCYFNGCRHMVAGEGWPDAGYTLSNCFFGPAGSLFPIDMHYLGENGGSGGSPSDRNYRYHAGELMEILNCTVAFSRVIDIASSPSVYDGGNPFAGDHTSAIVIGGLPTEGVVVKGCEFVHSSRDSAISQDPAKIPGHANVDSNGYARIEYENNQYGLTTDFEVGQP